MMRSVPVGAPQPWSPPSPPPPPSMSSSNATDNKSIFCTPGICSITCPQWCGSLFLPPPPPFLLDSSDDDDDGGAHISPLMAALIAVLAAAFLILLYYTVISRFCRRRRRREFRRRTTQILSSGDGDGEIRLDPMVQDPARPAAGLDDSFIRQITVFKYRRADGLIDGSDCAVCLSEFKEEESLRLMPNCEHAFHIPCIDTWLKSHSSCPLCRATMNPQLPARAADAAGPVSVAAAMMRVRRSDDVVLFVRDVVDTGGELGGEVIVCHHEVEEGGGEDVERENGEEEGARKGEIHIRDEIVGL